MSAGATPVLRPATRSAMWAVFVGVWLSSQAIASEPAPLAEMPSVERVRSEVQGASPLDTLAQQGAVFDALRQILEIRSGKPGALADPTLFSAEERAWVERYQAASREIFATPGVDPGDLLNAGMRYSATPGFRDEVAGRFFSPAWLADYAAARTRFLGETHEQPDEWEAPPAPIGDPGTEEDSGSFLDRMIEGPDGTRVAVRDLLPGAVKMLGGAAIAVLLVLRVLSWRKASQ